MKFIEEITFDFIEFLPFRKRPFKARLIPAKIWIDLDSYKDNIFGLREYCKKWRTKVRFIQDNFTTVGGEYDSEDNQVTLFIYSPTFPTVQLSEDTITWDEFKYAFIQALMHEMIHCMQYNNRNGDDLTIIYSFKKSHNDDEREYYSEIGEIQAYAHCIYLDLRCFSDKPIHDLLKTCVKTRESYTLTSILKTFNYEFRDNFGLHKLIKEVIRWERRYKVK